MAEERGSRKIPLAYVGMEDVPVLYANNFVIQTYEGDSILTIGQLSPPLLLGSDEERLRQVDQVSYVPVKVIARLSLSRARIQELLEVLSAHIERQEAQKPGGPEDGEDADADV